MSKLNELINEFCPDGVEYRAFDSVAQFIRGITYNKEQERHDGIGFRVLRANNITLDNNSLNFNDIKVVDSSVRIKQAQYLKKEDILICAGSGSKYHIGKVAFVDIDMDYTFGGFMGVIRVKNECNSRFMFHILTSAIFKQHLETVLNTSTINNINSQVISSFMLPIPPIEVQREIVRILDNFTELISTLGKELVLRRKQYEYYSNQLLTKNQNISYIELKKLATFTYGFTDKAKDRGNVRYIRITDIDDSGCLKQNDKKYLELSANNRSYILQIGDLVMARTGATFGKTLYFEDTSLAIYASFLIKINLDKTKILNRYYWHFSKSALYWEQANKLVSTGGQPQFNSAAIGQVVVPVPPLAEQERIVAILDRFDKLCNDISQGLPAEIEARKKQYEYYRDKLLAFKAK